MVEIELIKDKLRDDTDKILEILSEIGCHNPKTNPIKPEIRFGKDSEGASTGNSINTKTLSYRSFSNSKRKENSNGGDIITLVSEMLDIKLGKAIGWLSKKLNISNKNIEHIEIKLPFGGFFKEFSKSRNNDNPPKTYSYSELEQYNNGASYLFVKDGISPQTQEIFKIGYDFFTDRVTIPWLTEQGELCGIMGRINRTLEEGEKVNYKYLPIIPFAKSKVLYGFYENYKNIVEKGMIIVAESEKSVLQGRDKGINNVVALGGNEIHNRQARLIKSTYSTVIIALDEGIDLDHCIEQAKKVMTRNPFFKNEVYVVDMNNEYVKEKKVSLFDLDLDSIRNILEKHLIYVGE